MRSRFESEPTILARIAVSPSSFSCASPLTDAQYAASPSRKLSLPKSSSPDAPHASAISSSGTRSCTSRPPACRVRSVVAATVTKEVCLCQRSESGADMPADDHRDEVLDERFVLELGSTPAPAPPEYPRAICDRAQDECGCEREPFRCGPRRSLRPCAWRGARTPRSRRCGRARHSLRDRDPRDLPRRARRGSRGSTVHASRSPPARLRAARSPPPPTARRRRARPGPPRAARPPGARGIRRDAPAPRRARPLATRSGSATRPGCAGRRGA